MVTSFLKTFFRNFKFNKIYTLINLSGLTIGFTIFVLAGIYVLYELSYDNYHVNRDRIFRVLTDNNIYRGFTKFPVTPAPLGPAMVSEFPEVERYTRISSLKKIRIDFRNNSFFENTWAYADPDLFRMFSFNFIAGNAASALNSSTSVVLSERIAQKIFGTTDIIGEEINLRSTRDLGPFTVSAIIEDIPGNSIFGMDIITQFEGTLKLFESQDLETWRNSNYHTFLMLQSGSDAENLQAKFPFFRDKYTNDKLSQDGGQRSHYLLQPLRECHYDTEVAFELRPVVATKTLLVIATIASLILILAGINYVNLTSARSVNRAKEIGIRKVIGAHRNSLVSQFLSESIFISALAFTISFFVARFLLPYYSDFIGRNLSIHAEFGFILLLISLVFGIVAGIYPAYVLSSFKPVTVLKNKNSATREGSLFRDALVVFQFFASASLIVIAWVIQEQLDFIQTSDPGYNTSQILVVNWNDRNLKDYRETLKIEINRIPGVESTTVSDHLPNNILQQQGRTWRINGEDADLSFYTGFIDSDYISTLGMELLEGQNISPNETVSQKKYILNETAVRELGLENPVGMEILEDGEDTIRIIGVIKDFHYASFYEPIQPVRLCFANYASKVMVKFNLAHLQEIIWNLEQISKKFASEYQFDYDFLDEQFMLAYKSEQNTQTMASILTTIALLISGLGLFGLITFTINQRFKEIGIRKVFGANRKSLVILLLNKLNILIITSFVLAIPVSYLFLENWLQNFAFRIEIPISVYVYSITLLLIFSWTAVGVKTIKASGLNPVDILRHE